MNKRGEENMGLQTIVKTLPGIFVFVFAATALFLIASIVMSKPVSTPQRDLQRVASELMALSPGENFQVFLTGASYNIALYGATFPEKPAQCSTKPCLCVFETSGAQKCEVLKAVESADVCKSGNDEDLTIMQQCRRGPICVNNKEYIPVEVPDYKPEQPRHTLTICRGCDKLAIGLTDDACENLV